MQELERNLEDAYEVLRYCAQEKNWTTAQHPSAKARELLTVRGEMLSRKERVLKSVRMLVENLVEHGLQQPAYGMIRSGDVTTAIAMEETTTEEMVEAFSDELRRKFGSE
jgi:hypothetical protein